MQKNTLLVLAKNIFARIWALWALVVFIITFLIIFIPSMFSYFIDGIKGQLYFIKVSRFWMNVWLRLAGCPPTITGRQYFKPNTAYVVVFNHNALLDVPLSEPYVPVANKTIAKASFAKAPLFGLFYKKGSILIDRKNEQSRRKSFEEMKKVLQTGMSMCIYPEGSRNRTDGPLKAFHDGAFKLAIETKKEIIPCIILGTKEAMPINKFFYLWPTKLRMHFLPPVSSENISAKELKEKVFSIMHQHYVENEKP